MRVGLVRALGVVGGAGLLTLTGAAGGGAAAGPAIAAVVAVAAPAAAGAGQVTLYPGVSPVGITAGPDGALWFTSFSSIGRITTAGRVTRFTGTGINQPGGITV